MRLKVRHFVLIRETHCVKRVRIRSYSGPHFSRIRTKYGEILRISPYSVRMRENAEKMWTRITLNTDIFYAVTGWLIQRSLFWLASSPDGLVSYHTSD